MSLKVFPEVDHQGLGKVTKAIKEAQKAGFLDAKAAKGLKGMASVAAKEFRTVVAQAKMVNLHKEADLWQSKMATSQEELVKAVSAMSALQQKVGKEITQEEFVAQRKIIAEQLEATNARLAIEMKGVQKVIERRRQALVDMEGRTAAESAALFAESVGDEMSGMWSKMTSADFAGFTKGMSGALKKAGGALEGMAAKGGKGAAGMAAMGSSLTALAGAAAVLAGVVAAFAAVAKVMMDASAQAKEFNQIILQSGSIADFATKSGVEGLMDVESHLDKVREVSFGLAYQWRMTPKEILNIAASANEAGLTFKEMSGIINRNVGEMEAYTEVTKTAIIFSKQLGQSTETIAAQSAEWVHDLGVGLEGVQEGFSAIFTEAMRTGIGVKRFYTMVTQATSNLSLYNVRIEEAAALISELGESLGETNAAEFVKGLTKGFSSESYVERYKRLAMMGPEAASKTIVASAEMLGETFGKKVGQLSPEIGKKVTDAFKSADIDFDKLAKGDAEAIKKLSGLSGEQQRSLITQVRGADVEVARKLEDLVGISEGLRGGITRQAEALDELGPGGTLAMQLNNAMGVFGKPLSELHGTTLAGFQAATNLSSEQIHELQRVDRQIRGNYEAVVSQTDEMKGLADTDRAAFNARNKDMAKQFGLAINAQGQVVSAALDENGDVVTGGVVDGVEKYMVRQGDALSKAVEGGMTPQEALAQEVALNTASMSTQLETGVAYFLEKIYDAMNVILSLMPGREDSEATKRSRDEALQASQDQEQAFRTKIQDLQKEMSKTRVAADDATGATRDELVEKLSLLEEAEKMAKVGAEKESLKQREIRFAQGETAADVGAAAEVSLADTGGARRAMARVYGEEEAGKRMQVIEEKAAAAGKEAEAAKLADLKEMREASGQDPDATAGSRLAESWVDTGMAAEAGEAKKQEVLLAGLQEAFPDIEDISKQQLTEEQQTAEAMQGTDQEFQIGQTDTLTTAQTEEFTKLKSEYPKLTEKGYLNALRVEKMETAAGLISTSKEQKGEIFKRLRTGGSLTEVEMSKLRLRAPELAGMLGTAGQVDDFVYRGGSMGGTITPINQADELLGAKPGGPIAGAIAGAMGGNTFVFHINGGDPAKVYDVVKRAMRESGVRPPPGGG
jgi:hypothetical protein